MPVSVVLFASTNNFSLSVKRQVQVSMRQSYKKTYSKKTIRQDKHEEKRKSR
jgi:hypothetical protein